MTEETSLWFQVIESLKITCARSYAWFLNFYESERVWIVVRGISYPHSVKWLWPVQSSKKKRIGSVLACFQIEHRLWTAQTQQNDQFGNLCISCHGDARNIKSGQQVNIIERVPLVTPRVIVMSLVHNHMTDLLISSYRGATVIKFGQ